MISVVRDNAGDAGAAAAYLDLPLGLVQAAIGYHGAHRQESDEAHAVWGAGKSAVGRRSSSST